MLKKAKTSGIINTINEILTIARSRKIVHLYTEDKELNGREITLNGKMLINFGSCSYLGLETDPRLKEAAIDAVKRYGTQFSSSRTYVSFTLYKELEDLIGKMFNAPFLLSTCSTLGHQAVIPIAVEDNDAVILDQQAHVSMQDVAEKLQLRGITVTKLRHSRLDELQNKINELGPKHNKIWYFIDGVYSMYGDLAPMPELIQMLNRNKQLHLYADDAHGMSWAGKHGTGSVLGQVSLHPKMILCTSLAKGFGSAGGIFIFPNEELFWKVKNWGGPLTYSGPQQPAVVGASVASAKIHLSDEINERQNQLVEKVLFCNQVLKKYNLPVIGDSIAPIFFIGLGLTKVGYNMVRRMADDGYYVNLGIFPAVPETCTGVRFTLTVHHTLQDIENMAERLAYHLPLALKEEGRTMNDIYRAFRSVKKFDEVELKQEKKSFEATITTSSPFTIQHERTIQNIPEGLWNELLAYNGTFDWKGLALLEESFKNNVKPEDNWDFHYYIVRDSLNKPVIATFFTCLLTKDDMLAPDFVSREIEQHRLRDPYYLTSKSFMMGSLITEGQHLYIDKLNSSWKEAMMFLLDAVWQEQEKQKAANLLLRDFDASEIEMRDFLIDQGFVKIEMPDSHVVPINWKNREEYIAHLSSKKRLHLKQNVLQYEPYFDTEIVKNANEEQIERWYQLYDNVRSKGFEINSFKLPKIFFEQIAKSPSWECTQFKLKKELQNGKDEAVLVFFAYKTENYSNVMIGMDYDYLMEYKIYKQSLFQTIMRAIDLKAKNVYFGLTADFEKRKVGSAAIPKVAYVQMKDNFNMSIINLMPNTQKELVKK